MCKYYAPSAEAFYSQSMSSNVNDKISYENAYWIIIFFLMLTEKTKEKRKVTVQECSVLQMTTNVFFFCFIYW